MNPERALAFLAKQPAETRNAVESVLRGVIECEDAIRAFGIAHVIEGAVLLIQGRRPTECEATPPGNKPTSDTSAPPRERRDTEAKGTRKPRSSTPRKNSRHPSAPTGASADSGT